MALKLFNDDWLKKYSELINKEVEIMSILSQTNSPHFVKLLDYGDRGSIIEPDGYTTEGLSYIALEHVYYGYSTFLDYVENV